MSWNRVYSTMASRYTFADCFTYECISSDDSTPFETICYEHVRMLRSFADISEGDVFEHVYFNVQDGTFHFYPSIDSDAYICKYATIFNF